MIKLAKVSRRGIEYEGSYYCDRTLSLYYGYIFEIKRVKNYIYIFDREGALITKFVVNNQSNETEETYLSKIMNEELEQLASSGTGLKYNTSKEDIKEVINRIKENSYYEEIINLERKPLNPCEIMISRTKKNAGMGLAYIGLDHPAFKVVFKYFVNQNYPDLKKKLMLIR